MPSLTEQAATRRVAAYLRVSSEEQKQKNTVETQRGPVEQHCVTNGLEVHNWYIDEGVSGTTRWRSAPLVRGYWPMLFWGYSPRSSFTRSTASAGRRWSSSASSMN